MDHQVSPGIIPLTLYSNVRDNRGSDTGVVTWAEIVSLFREISTNPYEKKEDAPLFASAEFDPHRRAKANVKCSSMVVLDVDGSRNPEVATLENVDAAFNSTGITGLVCTTASHKPKRHKFRVLVPLEAPVSNVDYARAFWAMDTLFGSIADTTKQGAESLFYLPGCYTGVENEVRFFEGGILSASTWAEFLPNERIEQPPRNKTRPAVARLASVPTTWIVSDEAASGNLWDCPFVNSTMIEDYRSRRKSESFYNGLYRFMVATAGRAKRAGRHITPDELAGLASKLDDFDGGYYPKRDLRREAANAIAYVYSQEAR